MQIQVEENPNGPGSEQFVFKELGKPRPVKAIIAEVGGKETVCDVTGVGPITGASADQCAARWVPAYGIKIADSSEGHAFLIHGGAWGIRLKPAYPAEPWDFSSENQWGEPFKIYGSEEDIIYADE